MRHFPRFAALVSLVVVVGCSDPQPPIGHWQGAYEDTGLIIVARLQIDSARQVRVSAPNAVTDAAPLSDDERAQLRMRLESGLAASWPSVAPLPLEFDGRAFHKPGGVAPQLEWDRAANRMTLIFYSGNRRSVRVPLDPVADFDSPA